MKSDLLGLLREDPEVRAAVAQAVMQTVAAESAKRKAARAVEEAFDHVPARPQRRVYLAAAYGRRDEIAGYARQLRAVGLEIVSRWHDAAALDETRLTTTSRQLLAEEDWSYLREADTLIAFTHPEGEGPSRGGRHVELGAAIAYGHHVWLVGWRENLFCHLPFVRHWPSFGMLMAELAGEELA